MRTRKRIDVTKWVLSAISVAASSMLVVFLEGLR